MSSDRLFDVKNSFYLGNYQQCINEAQKLNTKVEAEKNEKEVFMYRAYIALGKSSIPASEINERNASPALKAVRRFAEFTSGSQSKRQQIVSDVEAEVVSGVIDETSAILAASILLQANNTDDALRVLHPVDTLEARALSVQALLAMDRVDVAVKELRKMAEVDEDATLTQLAQAWTFQMLGRDKLKDAFYIYQEMMDKYGQSPLLLVGQASTQILQEKYDEAEKLLQEAQQRDANNAEALINLVVVSEHLGKAPEVTNRYIAQMKADHPNHPWTKDLLAKEDAFDRIAIEA